MDLAELILTNKGDRSYETLARDCGGAPTAGRLQQIAGGTRKLANFPDPPSIRGLARGLHVTELAVVLAAAESLGLDVGRATPRLAQLLPAGVDRLSDQEVNAVLTMIQTMLGARPDLQPAVDVAAEIRRRRAEEREAADAANEADTGQSTRGSSA